MKNSNNNLLSSFIRTVDIFSTKNLFKMKEYFFNYTNKLFQKLRNKFCVIMYNFFFFFYITLLAINFGREKEEEKKELIKKLFADLKKVRLS